MGWGWSSPRYPMSLRSCTGMSQIAGGNGMPDNMEQGVNRREFFKSAFVELTKVVLEFSGAGGEGRRKRRNYLRPPGAVEEDLFNTLCTRCDECIKVCPHQCIRGSDSESETGARVGTPILGPAKRAAGAHTAC